MNDDLTDEISALNAIYDVECLIPSSTASDIYILQPPASTISPVLHLRLQVPSGYPTSKPIILDGSSSDIVALARDVLEAVWREGEVCFYDLVEGLREVLDTGLQAPTSLAAASLPLPEPGTQAEQETETLAIDPQELLHPWTLSEAFVEKKSVFLARAIHVSSVEEATGYIADLIAVDKKVAKATHNISAYRILKENGVVIQDNDDDGETAAGSRLAHLLQVMEARDVCVVVSRWYGGIKLGPDRFRLINTAARDALVQGGFVKDNEGKGKGKGGKSGKKGKK